MRWPWQKLKAEEVLSLPRATEFNRMLRTLAFGGPTRTRVEWLDDVLMPRVLDLWGDWRWTD